MLSCTLEKYTELSSFMICISQVKHPPQKFPDKNILKKYQYEERYKPLKFHTYIEMIVKCKFQMACNP